MIFVATNSSLDLPALRSLVKRRKIRVQVRNSATTSGYPSGASADEQQQEQETVEPRHTGRPFLTKRITVLRTAKPRQDGVLTDKNYDEDADDEVPESATTSTSSKVQPSNQLTVSKSSTKPPSKNSSQTLSQQEQLPPKEDEKKNEDEAEPFDDEYDEDYDEEYEDDSKNDSEQNKLNQSTQNFPGELQTPNHSNPVLQKELVEKPSLPTAQIFQGESHGQLPLDVEKFENWSLKNRTQPPNAAQATPVKLSDELKSTVEKNEGQDKPSIVATAPGATGGILDASDGDLKNDADLNSLKKPSEIFAGEDQKPNISVLVVQNQPLEKAPEGDSHSQLLLGGETLKNWSGNNHTDADNAAQTTPEKFSEKIKSSNEEEEVHHKPRVLTVGLGDTGAIFDSSHEVKLPNVLQNSKNKTSGPSKGIQPTRVLNIYLNSILKQEQHTDNTQEPEITTTEPTEPLEEPSLKKDQVLGPGDLVLRPQFHSSTENTKDLLDAFTKTYTTRSKSSEVDANPLRDTKSVSRKPAMSNPAVSSVNEGGLKTVHTSTVLISSMTQAPSEMQGSFSSTKAHLESSNIVDLPATSSTGILSLKTSFEVTILKTPSMVDPSKHVETTASATEVLFSPSFSSALGSISKEAENLHLRPSDGRSRKALFAGTSLSSEASLPSTLARISSTRSFDNEGFPTCQNTCFWKIVRRTKTASSLENLAASSTPVYSIKEAATTPTSSAPIGATKTQDASLLDKASASMEANRTKEKRKVKAESNGSRSLDDKSRDRSTQGLEGTNRTDSAASSLKKNHDLGKNPDLDSEDTKLNVDRALHRNSSKLGNITETKPSRSHGKDRLLSDVREILGTDFSLFGVTTPVQSVGRSSTIGPILSASLQPVGSSKLSPTPSALTSDSSSSRSKKRAQATLRGKLLVVPRPTSVSVSSSATKITDSDENHKKQSKLPPSSVAHPSPSRVQGTTARLPKNANISATGRSTDWKVVRKSSPKTNRSRNHASKIEASQVSSVYPTQVEMPQATPVLPMNTSYPSPANTSSRSALGNDGSLSTTRTQKTNLTPRMKNRQSSTKTSPASSVRSNAVSENWSGELITPTLQPSTVSLQTRNSKLRTPAVRSKGLITKSRLTSTSEISLHSDKSIKTQISDQTASFTLVVEGQDVEGSHIVPSKPLFASVSLVSSRPRLHSQSDLTSPVAATATRTPKGSSATRTLHKSEDTPKTSGQPRHSQDGDDYLVDGKQSLQATGNSKAGSTNAIGTLTEAATSPAPTIRVDHQDDKDSDGNLQDIQLSPPAVPVDQDGNETHYSGVGDDELSVDGTSAPDPSNEASGREFSRPMPLWPFLAPLLLLLLLPPAVWCLLRPEKLIPPPMPPPPPPPPPMPPTFLSWGRPTY